jgi:hypothetical protein
MATTTTYTSLFSDLQGYADKGYPSDTTTYAQIPRIINLSEREICTDLQLQGYEKTLLSTLQYETCIYAKPDRYRRTLSMSISTATGRKFLYPRSYEYLRMLWPDESEITEPEFYADHGDGHWLVAGTPDDDYDWEIKVYMLPQLLSESNQSNWLTIEAPDLLLSRALRNLAEFTRRYDDVARYDARYKERLASLAGQDMKKLMDRAAARETP